MAPNSIMASTIETDSVCSGRDTIAAPNDRGALSAVTPIVSTNDPPSGQSSRVEGGPSNASSFPSDAVNVSNSSGASRHTPTIPGSTSAPREQLGNIRGLFAIRSSYPSPPSTVDSVGAYLCDWDNVNIHEKIREQARHQERTQGPAGDIKISHGQTCSDAWDDEDMLPMMIGGGDKDFMGDLEGDLLM